MGLCDSRLQRGAAVFIMRDRKQVALLPEYVDDYIGQDGLVSVCRRSSLPRHNTRWDGDQLFEIPRQQLRFETAAEVIRRVNLEFGVERAGIGYERFFGYGVEHWHVRVVLYGQHQQRCGGVVGRSKRNVGSNRAGSRKWRSAGATPARQGGRRQSALTHSRGSA